MLNKNRPVEVIIDKEKCTKCGICTKKCCSNYIINSEDGIIVNKEAEFGCFLCGHCMMSCPSDAIIVKGEGLSEQDLMVLPDQQADYNNLYSLLLKRRSVRTFKKQEIPQEVLDKIIDAASTAPIGIPPNEVKVIVINGYQKVDELRKELLQASEKFLKRLNPLTFALIGLTEGKGLCKVIKEFCIPFMNKAIRDSLEGKETFLYNAPAVMVFNCTDISGKEDAILAATNALIAAEALGLGTCVIGPVPALLEYSKQVHSKYGINKGDKPGLAFILGYPDVKFNKAIRRHFKDIKYIN